MTITPRPSVGIIGAGRLGTVLARQLGQAGYHVCIANSRGPVSLTLTASILFPLATPATIDEVVERSDVIILALPLSRASTPAADLFAGKLLIDAMNYWPTTEGVIASLDSQQLSSSDYVQQLFPGARVVKSFSHVAYHELAEHSRAAGQPDRRALALAGNDVDAKRLVRRMIEDLGFDAVDVGPLTTGRVFEPDTAAFNARLSADQLRNLLALN